MRGNRGRIRRAAVMAGLALLLGACGPRYARVQVLDRGGVTVTLRSQKGGVDRGFAQPAIISGVRLAHILARIDVRADERKGKLRRAAVPTELVFGIGEALSKGLSRANSSQEVVVQALRTERRLGVFTEKHLTGLVVWVDGDSLVVHVTHVDRPVDKNPKQKLPEPWPGRGPESFKVLPAAHMTPVGTHSLAIDWRDSSFRKATNLRVGPTGRVRRRTILLESSETPDVPGAADPTLPELSPEALRALADIEEQRRSGELSESEYQDRRRAILEGAGGP